MLPIPPPLQTQFEDHLRKKGVPKQKHGLFKKWLRYYLDFCEKYQFRARGKKSLPEFLGKLGKKRQTKVQQGQATRAIEVFYEIIDENPPSRKPPMDPGSAPARQEASCGDRI
jgi:Phage integrase, N-terminal SAM-like domain